MPPCLTHSIIRHESKVKWSNPGKGVKPSPTSWCSSYLKGRLGVILDYNHQLYLLLLWDTKRLKKTAKKKQQKTADTKKRSKT